MTRTQRFPSSSPSRERGLTLVVVLVFLVMLMLIGATSMQTAGVEERMAGNGRDKSVAFEAAETTLRIAEDAVSAAADADFKATCENGLCTLGSAPDPNTYASWQLSDATIKHFAVDRTKKANGLPSDLAYNPGYYAEWQANSPGGTVYLGTGIGSVKVIRITAHAPGRDANTEVTLQSVVYH